MVDDSYRWRVIPVLLYIVHGTALTHIHTLSMHFKVGDSHRYSSI